MLRKIFDWLLFVVGLTYLMDAVGEVFQWRGRTLLGEEPVSWIAGAAVSGIVGIALTWLSIFLLRRTGQRGPRIALAILGWGAIAIGLGGVVAAVVDHDAVGVAVDVVAFGVIGFLLLRRVGKLRPQAAPALPDPPNSAAMP